MTESTNFHNSHGHYNENVLPDSMSTASLSTKKLKNEYKYEDSKCYGNGNVASTSEIHLILNPSEENYKNLKNEKTNKALAFLPHKHNF